MTSGFWTVEVRPAEGADDPRGRALAEEIACLGITCPPLEAADLYFIALPGGSAPRAEARMEAAARAVFADPVTQVFRLLPPGADRPGAPQAEQPRERRSGPPAPLRTPLHRATVKRRPGVMDPVEASAVQALADLGLEDAQVRTARRYYFHGPLSPGERQAVATKVLSNAAIEEVFWDDQPLAEPFAPGQEYRFLRVEVPLEGLSDPELLELSSRRTLSLDLEEMRAVRDHFRSLGRAPTDVELETLAQTWSEHCCHKTFNGPLDHRVVRQGPAGPVEERKQIESLFKETIRRATEEVAAPWCLSVFVDNAGVVEFDASHGVSFKVETHNHPSAIEPYGGAGTGVGGVIRDTLGTGLGAMPIASTDVFCFGPPDLPQEAVPAGALHPLRVLRGVVAGVRDYGNRMGIPTPSGALYFDERYVGNPLVFCGSVGLIPYRSLRKEVRAGDRIYACGGRTGRDGIHGATFSSLELTRDSERVSSGAVQIGNAITEKKLLDVLLQARDRGLYRSVTDCGAGGFSSAIGEMGASTGARVHLERAPLKYQGLSYTEIWISEAQERMVLAVPPEKARELEELFASEDVECTDIGEFTGTGRIELFYGGEPVADLDARFLHQGRPRIPRASVYHAREPAPARWTSPGSDLGPILRRLLAAPNIASKERIIRQYDHEVQGTSVLKPLQGGRSAGPGDACALSPVRGSPRAVVIGCGMNPLYGDLDPRRMAMAAVDEAVRNVVAVGGNPDRIALLDNFAWGNTRRPEVLGTLVEAARGCYEAAVGFAAPFISGKDSLNNEFQAGDRVISVPPSLLISSLALVEDARQLVSMDLKGEGNTLVLVGETREEMGGSHYLRLLGGEGGEVPAPVFPRARRTVRAVHRAIREGLVLSSHDLSEGGLGVAVAEMAFAGEVGVELHLKAVPRPAGLDRDEVLLFSESCTRFLLEARPADLPRLREVLAGVPTAEVGRTVSYKILRVLGVSGRPVAAGALGDLERAFREGLGGV